MMSTENPRPLLFERYPGLDRKIAYLPLDTSVTRVERLSCLGHDSLWIKRDDRLSPFYGGNKVRKLEFVLGDARNIKTMLAQPPDIVKLLGLCEYLTDEQIASIVRAAAEVMPPGATIVTNSLSMAHGTDRFFRRVFGLNMIYRDEQQMKDLLAPCGFGDFQVLPEPLGVYTVIVGRKA